MSIKHFPAIAALAACAAIAAPAAAAPHSWLEQKETERVDRTVPFHAGGLVRLKTFSGKVTITGTDGSDVVVHAVRRASRDRLDHIKLDVTTSGSDVVIDANKRDNEWEDRNNNVVETDFDIQVPRGAELDLRGFSSDIQVTGVTGRQKLYAFSGNLRVDGTRGPLEAETFSGNIEVKLDGGAGGDVDFNSFSGRLDTDVPMTLTTGGRRHVRGQVGSADRSNQFRFKTFSGDVRVR